jgi:hypothetical protein
MEHTAWAFRRSNWKGRTNGLLTKSRGAVLITPVGDSESLVTLVFHVYSTLSLQINKVRIKACKQWLHTYLPVIAPVFPANAGYVAVINCRSCCIMFLCAHCGKKSYRREHCTYVLVLYVSNYLTHFHKIWYFESKKKKNRFAVFWYLTRNT